MHRPFEIEMIRAEAAKINIREQHAAKINQLIRNAPPLLSIKQASEWMRLEYGTPQPQPLFGQFWQQHELCILFADTNAGKSVLAVQIADSITKEYDIQPFKNRVPPTTRVLYFDFEQSAKQFESRYVSEQYGSHHFAETFFRAQLNHVALPEVVQYKNYSEYIKQSMIDAVKHTHADILIIDNITYIGTGTQHANNALELMKTLKELKSLHNLSILVLAHTPKRNPRLPLTVNDLQGSKMLINFADSAFAIGQSHATPGLRYLKQVKQRNNHIMYGDDNICLMRLDHSEGYLQYKFEGYATETEHLMTGNNLPPHHRQAEILNLHNQGKSLREIARELNIHHTTVYKVLKKFKEE